MRATVCTLTGNMKLATIEKKAKTAKFNCVGKELGRFQCCDVFFYLEYSNYTRVQYASLPCLRTQTLGQTCHRQDGPNWEADDSINSMVQRPQWLSMTFNDFHSYSPQFSPQFSHILSTCLPRQESLEAHFCRLPAKAQQATSAHRSLGWCSRTIIKGGV